jgi:hypothetical protein
MITRSARLAYAGPPSGSGRLRLQLAWHAMEVGRPSPSASRAPLTVGRVGNIWKMTNFTVSCFKRVDPVDAEAAVLTVRLIQTPELSADIGSRGEARTGHSPLTSLRSRAAGHIVCLGRQSLADQ